MVAPYRADEVASAVMEAAGRAGLAIERLEVIPDERARVWLIRVIGPAGDDRRLRLPFASAQGIYTPAEIAARLLRGSWPFGARTP